MIFGLICLLCLVSVVELIALPPLSLQLTPIQPENLQSSLASAKDLMKYVQDQINTHIDTHPQLKDLMNSDHFKKANELLQTLDQKYSNPSSMTQMGHGSRPMVPVDKKGTNWVNCEKVDYAPALLSMLTRLGGENWTSTLPVLMLYIHSIVYYLGCMFLA
eukprot:c19082_g1_i1.p1 GENE.c19082_g1_i1~~c19082_g1_i1.p1  ORF type:complete len:161 (+),score=43.34 c19082_g1_i1:37-519(+)